MYLSTEYVKASYQSLRWWSWADSPAHPSRPWHPSHILCQVSGLHKATKWKHCDTEIKSSVMFCLCKSTEVLLNERWGGSVVKWPAVSSNGSGACGKTQKDSHATWLHNRSPPNCISWWACARWGASVLYLHWWNYRALVAEQKHHLLGYRAVMALWFAQLSSLSAWLPLIPLLTPTEVITPRVLQHEITLNAQQTHYQ